MLKMRRTMVVVEEEVEATMMPMLIPFLKNNLASGKQFKVSPSS